MASTGETSGLPGWVADALSSDGWLIANLQEAVGEFLKTFGNAVTNSIPGILSVAVNLSIDLVIFVFAVVTLFMEGPAILGVLKNLSPMNDEYEERLFQVFGEFSINMVIGSLATAAIQGVVAAIGFGIAGLDRIVFLGVATAVLSFIPLVGTMALWVPVCMYLGFTAGWEWATFVAVWSIVFTGTVDNLLRPFFMRGNTDIHPLLVFLSVFGGMYWMGIPGVLVGPVLVAFFLALYTIYLHDYLGVEVQKAEDTEGMIARVSGWFTALLDRFSSEKEPRGEGGSQNSGANNSAQEVEEATQSDEEEATQLDEEATDESL